MCKYINFNNLKKKKFTGEDVVVWWNWTMWKHKKQLKKNQKKK